MSGQVILARARRASMTVREIEITGPAAPFIAPGLYQASGGDAERRPVFGTYKLYVFWNVAVPDSGDPNGQRIVTLPRYYNIERALHGFRVGPSSSYHRDWTLVANRRPSRRDRLSPAIFRGVLAEVEVRTVERDSRQQPLPEHSRYSVVARVVRVFAGGGPR